MWFNCNRALLSRPGKEFVIIVCDFDFDRHIDCFYVLSSLAVVQYSSSIRNRDVWYKSSCFFFRNIQSIGARTSETIARGVRWKVMLTFSFHVNWLENSCYDNKFSGLLLSAFSTSVYIGDTSKYIRVHTAGSLYFAPKYHFFFIVAMNDLFDEDPRSLIMRIFYDLTLHRKEGFRIVWSHPVDGSVRDFHN